MADAAAPLLLFLVGPPAVGKMSVGQAIAERTGLRLFHNHISIEVALRYFDYGTPAFYRIDGEIRRLVIEEVAASDLPGLIFTFVLGVRHARRAGIRRRVRTAVPRARSARAVRRACTSSIPLGGSTTVRTICVSTTRCRGLAKSPSM